MAQQTVLEKKQRKLLDIFFGINRKKKNKTAQKKLKQQRQIAYLKKMPYSRFLKTKYWSNVRSLVLKRDGFKCRICESKIRLEVHHDTYKHHGDELNNLKDLLTLCHKCHQEHHFAM